jgi:surfeit locus 1 family protein
MKKIPPVATIAVLIAVAIMIGLGVWQLQRKTEKDAVLALAAANPARAAVAFPKLPPVDPHILFRPSSVHCLNVVGWAVEAGRAADGTTGYRYIASCATGAEGPGVLINMGVADKGDLKPAWTGGQAAGWISEEPDHRPLIARIFGKAPPLRPMLIAKVAAPGLKPSAPPRVEDIPNNHLAYAVQWFVFAFIALVIYGLALRYRRGDDGEASA